MLNEENNIDVTDVNKVRKQTYVYLVYGIYGGTELKQLYRSKKEAEEQRESFKGDGWDDSYIIRFALRDIDAQEFISVLEHHGEGEQV